MDRAGGDTGPGDDGLHEAFVGLVEGLRAAEERLRTTDPPLAEPDRLDGYRWIFSLLAVGLDAYVWADTGRPRFVDIVGPHRKWGGDNVDAFYQLAPIDPARTYRVRCVPGDAVYLSLTVYGGPDDGRYSERIVGSLNDRTMRRNPDGSFDLVLSPEEPKEPKDGVNWLRLEPDAVVGITRDYLAEPTTGRRAVWSIEATDPPAAPTRSAADLARRFGAATTWLAEQVQMCPIRVEPVNEVQDPYPVPTATFGWAAGDAAYAMGSYELAPGEALVIDGRSPECAFWNLCLWNPFLHVYDAEYDRVTINGHQVVPAEDGDDEHGDGAWRIVVAAEDPGHPNWVSTQGRTAGLLWFRWFLPAATPDRPTCRVVPIAEAGGGR